MRVGGCTPTPFQSIYHHEESCGVRSNWEGIYTPPVSPLLCVLDETFPIAMLWIRIWIWIGYGAGLDPGGRKLPTKIEKKLKSPFFKCWMFSILRAEDFSCSFAVLCGGLGISYLQFLINFNFRSSKPWIRIRIHLKCWVRIPNQRIRARNTAPQDPTWADGKQLTKIHESIVYETKEHCVTFSNTHSLKAKFW